MVGLNASVTRYSQGEHIGKQDGLCNPSSVLMAYAINTGKVDLFIAKLKAMTKESKLVKQLRLMHEGTRSSDAKIYKKIITEINQASTMLTIDGLKKDILFGGKSRSYLIDYEGRHRISFTGVPAPLRGAGKYDIYLFDANVGLAKFKGFKDFQKSLKKQSEMYSKLFNVDESDLVQKIIPLNFEGMNELHFESESFEQIVDSMYRSSYDLTPA